MATENMNPISTLAIEAHYGKLSVYDTVTGETVSDDFTLLKGTKWYEQFIKSQETEKTTKSATKPASKTLSQIATEALKRRFAQLEAGTHEVTRGGYCVPKLKAQQ
jgi:hypothetical protein